MTSPSASLLHHLLLQTRFPTDVAKIIHSYIAHFIYRFGAVEGHSLTMNIYESESERNWISLTPMPTLRTDASAAIINDRYIFVTGGDSIIESATVECFDIVTERWSSKASMNQTRKCHCTVSTSGSGIGNGNGNGNGSDGQ